MNKLTNCLINKDTSCFPVWFMRQAGRYLPEFRKIRANNPDFIKLCLNSDLSSEITLQPINRFNIDAAIIFSDILMVPYATGQNVTFKKTEGPILAASDYMRMSSDQIRPYIKKSFYSLGTDGYGRSDTRKNLRKFFEVDKEHIVTYGLSILAKEQLIASKYAKDAIKKYKIDTNKPMPTKL